MSIFLWRKEFPGPHSTSFIPVNPHAACILFKSCYGNTALFWDEASKLKCRHGRKHHLGWRWAHFWVKQNLQLTLKKKKIDHPLVNLSNMSFCLWTLGKKKTKVLPKIRMAGESGAQRTWSRSPSHLFIKGIRQVTICWWSHCLDQGQLRVVILSVLTPGCARQAVRCLAQTKQRWPLIFSKAAQILEPEKKRLLSKLHCS